MELEQYVTDCLSYYDRIYDQLLLSSKERILATAIHGTEQSVIAALRAELKTGSVSVQNWAAVQQGNTGTERESLASELQAKQLENASKSAVHESEMVVLLNASKLCTEEGIRIGLKGAKNSAIKVAGKGAAVATSKGASKFVPVVGPLLAGSGFALYRLVNGEYVKAGAELASGVVGTIPGVGTAASLAIDAGIASWDVYDAYYEGKSGLFDTDAQVKLSELLLQVEISIKEHQFSVDDFLDGVFDKIDKKMKVSCDNLYVVNYIHGIYKDFFNGEVTIDTGKLIQKMQDKGYKRQQWVEVQALLKKENE